MSYDCVVVHHTHVLAAGSQSTTGDEQAGGTVAMCELSSSKSLSRLGIACGALSLATLLTAFVSSVWLFTREPVRLPNSEQATSITFRIGLWRVCPTVNKVNFSQRE
ncbi:hypothetical protein PR048_023026 [Dryococelus australis]|uniref:Uncharacterized protein n=1 Tax=Dryococelus australis TaxID=614101 RepID=A0ABQ9GT01_9NEOP|nr:hypothetical protein PR048_023026 [Dryococelus australis]